MVSEKDHIWRRIGRFSISQKIISEDPGAVKVALAGVIVVRAEAIFYSGDIEYVGLCDEFDEVPDGSIPHDYDIEIDVEQESHHVMSTDGVPEVVMGRRHITRRFTRKAYSGVATGSLERGSW